MHIMNNMCKQYKQLKLVVENKGSYLDDLDKLQTTIQDHWQTYYFDKDADDDSDDEESEDEKNKYEKRRIQAGRNN